MEIVGTTAQRRLCLVVTAVLPYIDSKAVAISYVYGSKQVSSVGVFFYASRSSNLRACPFQVSLVHCHCTLFIANFSDGNLWCGALWILH